MMKVIGIDVSKLHLDLALLDQDGKVLQEAHISNKASCLRKLLRSWIKGQCSGARMLVCLEPTGPYSFEAIKTMLAMGVPVWLAHPADIKNSLGMTRGKSDQVDARRIAQYALRFGDKARFLDETFLHLQELKICWPRVTSSCASAPSTVCNKAISSKPCKGAPKRASSDAAII